MEGETGMAVENILSQYNPYIKTGVRTRKVTEVDEGIEKLQGSMSTFSKSMKWLKKYKSGASSKTRLEKEINSLVKAYNEMGENMDDVTDKDVKKQMAKLDKMFSENEKSFNKIGVEKVNGKYKFDSKKLEKADEKILSALFEEPDSFVRRSDKIMRKLEASTDDAHYRIVDYKI